MNIEYIIYNNQLAIKDKNNEGNNILVPNVSFYFMIITSFLNDHVEQWFWYNIETNSIINTINSILEKGGLFSVQLNLSFCNHLSSKFIQYLRDILFPEFNTQLKKGYRVLIAKEGNIIKSTAGSFIKLAIHNNNTINFNNCIQNGIITPDTQKEEKKFIEEHHKFLKEKISLEKQQNQLLDKKDEMMGIMEGRKREIENVKIMTQILEAEENKLLQIYKENKDKEKEIDKKTREEELQKLILKKEEEREKHEKLVAERERLFAESKKTIKDKNDKLIKEMRERYQKELLISQDNAERSKKLISDLEAEKIRLEQRVKVDNEEDKKIAEENKAREFQERAKEYLEKKADDFFNNLNKKYQEEKNKNNFENKTNKLLEDHQKIQQQLYQEKLQDELSKFVYHGKKQNELLDSLNSKREEINKKVQSSNCKELKQIVNEMDKYFNERKTQFDNNIEQELSVIKNRINDKLDSIENRKKTLQYIEQLNKQKVMWISLLQNQIKQYNSDQKTIDQYLQELDKKYHDEALKAVKMFKSNINLIIDEDKIKKDLTNILKFKEDRDRLLKQYNEEYEDLKKIEKNYNKNREEYVTTMKQIVKEWSDKKNEEYNKKREEEREILEKRRVKYLKSCEDALQFNFDRFVNKCEEIRDKFTFNDVDKFVQKESNEQIKELAKKEIEKQQEKWNKLNNEKIRLDNILKEQKKLQLEEAERRKKEELEMRRERKKMKLEEERKRVREERAARKKGLNKSLRIW